MLNLNRTDLPQVVAVRLDAGVGHRPRRQLGLALLPQVRGQVAGGAQRRPRDHARGQPGLRGQRAARAAVLQVSRVAGQLSEAVQEDPAGDDIRGERRGRMRRLGRGHPHDGPDEQVQGHRLQSCHPSR